MSGPIVIALDVIAYLALLAYIAHAWAAEAKRERKARAAWVVADTLARQKRTAELHEWQRQTRVEFEKALQGRPFLAAVRAEAEASGLDDEWAAIQENGWAS